MKSIHDIMSEPSIAASKALRRAIMRRIWYAYALSILTHGFFVRGLLLGACIALFGRLVHVASVADNVLRTPLRELPSYVQNAVSGALASGEVVTVVVTFCIIGLSVSLARVLARLLFTASLTRAV